jgi:multidrug resistance efflux pump
LYQQKEAMVGAALATLGALKRQLDASTQEQRANAGKAANTLFSDFTHEKYRYDQLVAEGVKKAADWERQRR